MILDDPALEGVAAVLFDEFHERSLDADLGLALARDFAAGRCATDLRLLVMSATLDGARVAALLGDAPVIESEGRAFPVETRYLGRDAARTRSRTQVARAIRARAARPTPARVLVFLPGQAEIRRTETCLRERVCRPGVDLAPLYGALTPGAGPGDRAGAARAPQGRARDLHRRDQPDHRGRAGGRRLRPLPRAALRAAKSA